MSRIDTGRYRPAADNPNMLEYIGQKSAKEIFDELKYRLKAEDCLPDEHFLLNDRYQNGEPFPADAEIMCNVNFGNNEGISLDIMLRDRNAKGEAQYTTFATGTTLGDSEGDLDRMYLAAAACAKAFYSPAVHSRFVSKEKETGGEKTAEGVSSAPTVLRLSEREKKIVTESLVDMRARYKAEKRPLEEVEQLLRRIVGTITEYIKSVGERPQNLDYGDIASLAIADGNLESLRESLPHVPHLYGNLLLEAVSQSDNIAMTHEILSASDNSLSNDIYMRACAAAIQNSDAQAVRLLMVCAENCVRGLDKEFYSDVLLRSFSGQNESMPKAIIGEMTASQIKEADPHILKIALMEKNYDAAKELIYKGIDVASGSAMLLFTAAKQKNVEIAQILLDHGADPNGQNSSALSACMRTNDVPSAMFLMICGADFNKFMDTIADKFSNGKLSEDESAFVFAAKSFWENRMASRNDAAEETEHDDDMEQE